MIKSVVKPSTGEVKNRQVHPTDSGGRILRSSSGSAALISSTVGLGSWTLEPYASWLSVVGGRVEVGARLAVPAIPLLYLDPEVIPRSR